MARNDGQCRTLLFGELRLAAMIITPRFQPFFIKQDPRITTPLPTR
jgi:hypothetical protein